jgi:hypothetical protein
MVDVQMKDRMQPIKSNWTSSIARHLPQLATLFHSLSGLCGANGASTQGTVPISSPVS